MHLKANHLQLLFIAKNCILIFFIPTLFFPIRDYFFQINSAKFECVWGTEAAVWQSHSSGENDRILTFNSELWILKKVRAQND